MKNAPIRTSVNTTNFPEMPEAGGLLSKDPMDTSWLHPTLPQKTFMTKGIDVKPLKIPKMMKGMNRLEFDCIGRNWLEFPIGLLILLGPSIAEITTVAFPELFVSACESLDTIKNGSTTNGVIIPPSA